MVPPWASSKRPMRWSLAPVKAPFAWPKSSLSNSEGASAGQLVLWKKKKAEKEPIARAPAEEKSAEQSLSKRAIQ